MNKNTLRLSDTQAAVFDVILAYRSPCRRDFAANDIYEVSARVAEIERKWGIRFERGECKVHNHKRRFTTYILTADGYRRLADIGVLE